MKLILGSSSKSRQDVLREAGYDFEVITVGIDEKSMRFEDPEKLVLALAHEKAKAILSKIKIPGLLITADQVVVCNGTIREKPIDEEQAREFIECYRNYPMETVSSLVLTNTETGKFVEGIDVAKVYFREFPESVIDEAIKDGRVMRCSGAMRCEDPPFNQYIDRFEGTKDSTSGLPLKLLSRLIGEIDIK